MEDIAAPTEVAGTAVDFESAAGFELSVSGHIPTMRRVAAAVGGATNAEEISQDALLRAWRRRSTYRRDRGSVRVWLLAITADQARRTRSRSASSWPAELRSAPDEGRLDAIADLDLRRAIDSLAPRQRQTVLLHYYVDLPVHEVAELMDCSTGTVKSTLSDARANLARKLETPDE